MANVTYEITAPNGKAYQIEGPEGATDEQVRAEVLRQFPDSAGTLKQYPDTVRTPAPQPSVWQQLATGTISDLAGLAQGVLAVPDAAFDLAKFMSKDASHTVSSYLGNLFRVVGADRLADRTEDLNRQWGEYLDSSPNGSQAIEQLSPTPPGLESSRLVSQLVGGMMVPMGPKSAPRIRAPKISPQAAEEAGSAADIVAEGARNNVRVMTSDVKPPRTFMGKMAQATGERIPYAGTGGTRAAQQSERVQAVKDLAQEYGTASVDDIAADLSKTRGDRIRSLTAQKNSVIKGLAGAVDTPRAISEIDTQIARLTGINADAYAPVIAKLQGFKKVLQSGKSLEQIEGNRKLLGDLFADPTLANIKTEGEKAVSAIYAPLREDMGVFISKNGTKDQYQGWVKANDELASMAGELDSSAFKNVLKNAETTPEQVGKLIFSKNPSDVRRLMGNLSAEGQTKVRSALIQHAFEKAGGEEVSPDRFANQLKSLSGQIGAAFEGGDLARVQGLQRLIQATKRASAAAAAPPTGVQNAPILGGYAAGSALGWWALPVGAVGGVLARLYESPATRNLLIGLAKSKPGSKAEGQFLRRLTSAAAAQAEIQSKALSKAANDTVGVPVAAGDTEENQQEQQRAPQP